MIEAIAMTYIPLAKAGRLLTMNPAPATLWRWAMKGIDGIKLETYRIGGRRYTTAEALDRFVARLSDPRSANIPQVSPRRDQQKNRATERAKDIYN